MNHLTSLALRAIASVMLIGTAWAAPPVWESDFGDEIEELTGRDDHGHVVELSFPFPFEGADYTMIHVSTNGGIRMENTYLTYSMSSDLDEFYDDGGYPILVPLNTDLDLTQEGAIHFRDFGNRAVFTWNEVGTNEEETHLITFQIQLFPDGRIVFSYNGILDDPGEDLIESLDEGILVGISGSTGILPDPSDLSEPSSTDTDTLYEVWHDEDPPENSLFDLDMKTVVFVPKAGGGFMSSVMEEPKMTQNAIPDLQIGKSFHRLRGNNVYDKRKASKKQTLVHRSGIFTTNTASASLLMENDGGKAATFQLKTQGDHYPGMTVFARVRGGGNIAAALRRNGYRKKLGPGESVKISYRLVTGRFYAGSVRRGSRHDAVEFRLVGAGKKDNAALINQYHAP